MGKQKGARLSKRVALVLGVVAAVVLAAAAPALAQSGSANNSGSRLFIWSI